MSAPSRNRNRDVSQLLEEIGDLLEIKGEQAFRVNAYRNAARRIDGLREPIDTVHGERRLRGIQGVGPALEQKIGEFLDTGHLEYLERLREEIPPGLVELLAVPGLGPRKARVLYDELQIGNLAELEAAARANRLRGVAGLGEKTEENIVREIERLQQRSTRRQLGEALATAEELLSELRECPAVVRCEYAGSLRRMVDTIGDVDILVASDRGDDVERFVVALGQVHEVLRQGPSRTSVIVRDGLQVDFRVVEPWCWGAALQYFTGSKAHNVRLREMALQKGWTLSEYGLAEQATGKVIAAATESDVYEALGLQIVPPELREDSGEVELASKHQLPRLLDVSDIQGDLHVHSEWSDGSAPIEAMARAAIAAGRTYMALTDHSKSLGVARGLTEERVAEQAVVIGALNRQLAPFRIFHGTEMDIKRDGLLDYEDETLASLEYVSASIHSSMNQPREVMTDRIIRAISNPYVATLNHPHGRLIGSRDSYDVDMDAVVRAASDRGVALEINSQPSRMDLDGVWARRAKDAGARLAINTDSHAPGQLDLMRFGVASARRAWLTADDVLNALPLDLFAEHLATRRRT